MDVIKTLETKLEECRKEVCASKEKLYSLHDEITALRYTVDEADEAFDDARRAIQDLADKLAQQA